MAATSRSLMLLMATVVPWIVGASASDDADGDGVCAADAGCSKDAVLAADDASDEVEEMRHVLLQRQTATKSRDTSVDAKGAAAPECDDYMKEEGCAWTKTWNCPGQSTSERKGHARNDNTLGYQCCCQEKLWQSLPTPAPTPPPPPGAYWSTGYHKNMTVYHQTSPEVCDLIMKGNFKIGKGGLCGKAIYFALTPEATRTKAITSNSHGGCMIEAVVDVGKTGRFYWRGGAQWKNGQREKYCGGWNNMKKGMLHKMGYDSIVMRQGDGDEVIIFEPERILEKRIMPFKCHWMCTGACHKHWPSHCRWR